MEVEQRLSIQENQNAEMKRGSLLNESKNFCKKITQPKPFKFHTSSRTNKNDQSLQIINQEENNFHFKPKTMPKYNPFFVKKSTAQLTVPKTFNLTTQKRGEEKLNQSMMQVESIDNDVIQNYQFKALPMPNYTAMATKFINNKIEIKKPTVPKQIKFRTDSRNDIKRKTVHSNSEEKQYQFKAKPIPMNKVFQVKKKIQKVKVSNEKAKIPMNLVQRSAKRTLFEDKVNEKKMEEKQFKEMQEKNKIDSLRKDLTFKATPIKKYKQIEIQKSAQKPTVPIEKKFETDVRASKMKISQNNQSKENFAPNMIEN